MSDLTLTGNDTEDYTVLSLNRNVSSLLKTAFHYPVWLRGEIAKTPRPNTRGHLYFQLIEPDPGSDQSLASIDCVLFAGSRAQVVRDFAREGMVFELSGGKSVRLLGAVDVWPQGGRYQFIVQRIDPALSQGEQALQLGKLLKKLSREGVLKENSSLSLCRVPLRVGLVTSETSAAAADFLETLKESGYPFQVYAAWAPMQGKQTAKGIVDAFNRLLEVPDLDVVVLSRGGGSATDLNWLNDESIARTIAQLPWPVISGIGHETDTTLPDFAAHTRTKTPTHAASVLVDRVADFIQDLDSLCDLLVRSALPGLRAESTKLTGLEDVFRKTVENAVKTSSLRIDGLAEMLISRSVSRLRIAEITFETIPRRFRSGAVFQMLGSRRNALGELSGRMAFSLESRFRKEEMALEKLSGVIEKRNPEKMLALGWAIVKNMNGGLVDSVNAVSGSDEIDVTLKDGSLLASVREVHKKGSPDDR